MDEKRPVKDADGWEDGRAGWVGMSGETPLGDGFRYFFMFIPALGNDPI